MTNIRLHLAYIFAALALIMMVLDFLGGQTVFGIMMFVCALVNIHTIKRIGRM